VHLLRLIAAWLGAGMILLIYWTCRVRHHDDPRPALRSAGHSYVYAFLHAHQLATVIGGERGTAAMLSRSADGDFLAPALRVRGIIPMRGSTRRAGRDKGGKNALEKMIAHSRAGSPTYFAVDGPRGPRNHVGKGVAVLARATGAHILAAVALPSRRWILGRTWDRFQIPLPFGRIDVHYGRPFVSSGDVDSTCLEIRTSLTALETRHDPVEAARCLAVAGRAASVADVA
jgi:lysophospholipid acyltransferase (LPLAT)-like uncharacterized protein